jgi:hypothetical protein
VLLRVHLPGDQMKFAITCFSLAGLVLIAFAAGLRGTTSVL